MRLEEKTTMPDKREELAQRIRARIAHDEFWGAANFGFAHILAWVAVLSSFGSAIAAASKAPAIFTAALAGIPGCVIVLARSLNFMPLSRWHHKLAARLQAVERSLEFENKSVEEISVAFSSVMLEFENNSPALNVAGLLEHADNESRAAARKGWRAKKDIPVAKRTGILPRNDTSDDGNPKS